MSAIEWSQRSAIGLRHYVALVVEAVGADMDAVSVTYDLAPACAYIGLDARLAHFLDMRVAMLWDEENGWSVSLETPAGELIVLSFLGREVLPAPRVVAEFLDGVLTAEYPGQPHPPRLRTPGLDHALSDRLADYTQPET